jgi:hypothetical protein
MSEILLPVTARNYYLVNKNYSYNSNYDVIWSFQYTISGFNSGLSQLGYTTFLTTLSSTTSYISAGQYLCTKQSETQNSATVLSGTTTTTVSPFNLVTIAFDSTGLFALSSTTRPGLTSVTPNSLVIRGYNSQLLCVLPLSSTSFSIAPTSPQTIRCIYSNGAQTLEVSYRDNTTTEYTTLTTVSIPYRFINTSNVDRVYAGISYCSPISSSSLSSCRLLLNNMHIEGSRNKTDIETIAVDILS